jgi:hypothetical protein
VLGIVSDHVNLAQEILGRQILLENPSAYLGFIESEIPEWEFLSQLCARTGCGLLLDVNNIYVSAHNLGFDPADYIAHFPFDHVCHIHIAGHSQGKDLLIDTHDQPVCVDVWDLFEAAMTRVGPVAVKYRGSLWSRLNRLPQRSKNFHGLFCDVCLWVS